MPVSRASRFLSAEAASNHSRTACLESHDRGDLQKIAPQDRHRRVPPSLLTGLLITILIVAIGGLSGNTHFMLTGSAFVSWLSLLVAAILGYASLGRDRRVAPRRALRTVRHRPLPNGGRPRRRRSVSLGVVLLGLPSMLLILLYCGFVWIVR